MQVDSSTEHGNERGERREMIRQLRETEPAIIAEAGEAATLEAFQRTVTSVPAYRSLIVDQLGIDPATIQDIQSFRSALPLLDKAATFGAVPVRDLCVGGEIGDVRSLLTSSGHGSHFSFGVNTAENLQRSARSIDMGLQYIFGVDERRTLLINALPMGVKVHTHATVLAETSVRDDMVHAVVQKYHGEFDQIIIVGEGSFVKKIIEDGREKHSIDWENIRVHLILGEEGIAENYRTYMGDLIGIEDFGSREDKVIMSSMGVAELDLNIFHETFDTVRLRRRAHADPQLREALFGPDASFCPMFFVYYPHRCYVEELSLESGPPELVMSMLSPEMKLPLMRYRTGDRGRIFSYKEVVEKLSGVGMSVTPDLKLPFVAVYGRGASVGTQDGPLYPEAVKEGIYAVPGIASKLTGNFRILPTNDAAALIRLQVKRGEVLPANAEDDLATAIAAYTPARYTVEFLPYDGFPYSMEVDWERKFRYV